ncbi:energy-coupling factor transporter transmembrane component T [Lacticaseibacillus zeae]|uniref:Energy-coupling factor transporter transmembrane component T n=1 Tax=Lacticaseibacillus zeae subsp. silagei TaxID=3068307 RepID=A0ABD7ZAI4_LACZE|nr:MULTISPECIES: energy-coupling factor transporter transmembrane component T [Lacticaseibacillus]MDE3314386.1 energy-coupling factor transporter transmembrane protein EcfT [Lacticaseibacillus zeae]OFR98923.1 cobalt ABC transporter permease [Lactobacillus sp. HMSC068F07]WLV84018.1 energy-coupling factor transporter transmembrane component T [Lacticaseibacillus sp. NCIMB 15475]WLV86774.1 energy-coupling factor transporter transmembrane component T [Lacticaseibacillus sp. NCIMB 15474]
MLPKKTNALNLSLLILLLTLEISFSHSVKLDLALIGLATGFLLWRRAFKSLVVLALLPLIPAASTYWAITLHGTDMSYALLLFVRTYAFTALGLVFLIGVDLEALLLWLEQHKLSPNFVYGLLVVIHALPQIMHEVAAIREASLLRGQKLHPWSPMIYVKVIFVAMSWQDQYVKAMYAHGYTEGAKRNVSRAIISSRRGLVAAAALFLLLNVLVR